MDERAYIARVEGANTEEFVALLQRPSAEEDRLLRMHLGAARYDRLRQLALRSQRRTPKKGNVVLLHGILGGELTVLNKGSAQKIWIHLPRIVLGGLGWFRMQPGGTSVYDVSATGMLKRYYGEMLLRLGLEWETRAFWYDWRLDLASTADSLNGRLTEWFGGDAPVHLVAHSMGGLVARTFILRHPQRWSRGGRLVMLGTPNHGSFAIPQIAAGLYGTVRKLAAIDLRHSLKEVVEIVNGFPGSFNMLPSPLAMPTAEPLYQAAAYKDFEVSQEILDGARRSHERLRTIVDRERMIYIAGFNRPTVDSISDYTALEVRSSYQVSMKGDGTVPHSLGFLEQDGKRILTYFADAEHGELANAESVIASTLQLLETGKCSLPQDFTLAVRSESRVVAASEEEARARTAEARLRRIAEQTQVRGSGRDAENAPVASEETEAERIIVREFLSNPAEGASPSPAVQRSSGAWPDPPVGIFEIALIWDGIENVGRQYSKKRPVDAIAVGHYIGVSPQAAELRLDEAVSGKRGKKRPDSLLLTEFAERGLIRGELLQPFMIPDPRDARRLIVLAGMGLPGHFGAPELTVAAQELCWMLGRLGRHHLAAVLIGAGAGNLSIEEAVSAWLRGIHRALSNASQAETRRLCQITFVEKDGATLRCLDQAFRRLSEDCRFSPWLRYRGPRVGKINEARKAARKAALKKVEEAFDGVGALEDSQEMTPVRISVGFERDTYQFAAITSNASVPQRNIPLDPRVVAGANDELATAATSEQLQCGKFLERLLIPTEIRGLIYTPAPIVLTLDATTARVHWEMVARSEARLSSDDGGDESFLGTSYGLTRQLRTTFAPPPEPPPSPRRTLRALIIADPAEESPLPSAQAEGEQVAECFERFNFLYAAANGPRVEVVRLFGPAEARLTTVLKKLMLEKFDVLHFAGHCVYDAQDRTNSGWIFSDNQRFTANELQRIDRVPVFIFSNACESGATPDRSDQRLADLPPSFAEAFFARGVSNFVCTAWPVNDEAARMFAQSLYGELLGLTPARNFARLHWAMRQARRVIASEPGGTHSWGAYQHYGNPFFQFFANSPAPDDSSRK